MLENQRGSWPFRTWDRHLSMIPIISNLSQAFDLVVMGSRREERVKKKAFSGSPRSLALTNRESLEQAKYFGLLGRHWHTRGLVPTTSPRQQITGTSPIVHVNWPFLLQNLVAGTNFGPWNYYPRIQTTLNFWDKSLRLVPQNASCELFVGQVPATSPFV